MPSDVLNTRCCALAEVIHDCCTRLSSFGKRGRILTDTCTFEAIEDDEEEDGDLELMARRELGEGISQLCKTASLGFDF